MRRGSVPRQDAHVQYICVQLQAAPFSPPRRVHLKVREKIMADYKKMYHIMFNAATDAERLAKESSEILRKAQKRCEEIYLESEDTPITIKTLANKDRTASN